MSDAALMFFMALIAVGCGAVVVGIAFFGAWLIDLYQRHRNRKANIERRLT